MYELSRVRLHSIGPPGARFADVLVDFSGVGAPVAGPRQDILFPPHTPHAPPVPSVPPAPRPADSSIAPRYDHPLAPDHATTSRTTRATGDGGRGEEGPAAVGAPRPRRPSPASVLFLENGGGKSVLIKLIFSVVLPGRRHVVGTSNGRVLDNFILPRDCGHVVCEWQHAVTGERVVTGKVSEWRGRAAADAPRLAEAWYSFRPGDRLGITTLPLTQEGRLVTLAGFRTRLADAAAADPALDLTWETSQGAWSEHLDAVGLDPELFRYQRAMNAGEGEAAEAFSFTTDEQFVDFLLRAVTPPEDPAGLADVVDGYATKLAERAALSAEREFVAGALDRLGPLVEAVDRRAAAGAAYQGLRAEIALLRGSVRARLDRDAAGLTGLAASTDAARVAERDAEVERTRRHDDVLALRRRMAELRLAGAEQDRDRLVAAARDANREVDAWRATDDVLRLAAASAAAQRLTLLVADAENVAAPALADRDRAARALLHGLLALATASGAAADEAEAQAAEHERRAGEADEADRRASDEAAQARAREQALRDRAQAAAEALATAVRAGLLPAGGTDLPGQAQLAATAARAAATAVRDALAAATRAQDRRDVDLSVRAAERTAVAARAAAARLAGDIIQARDAASALLANGRVAALLGVDEPAPAGPHRGDAAGTRYGPRAESDTYTKADTEAAEAAELGPTDPDITDLDPTGVVTDPTDPDITALDTTDPDTEDPDTTATDTTATGIAATGIAGGDPGPDGLDTPGTDPATDPAATGTTEPAERVLDRVAEAASARIGEAVQDAERRRLELSLAADVDRRVLGALGEGDLRPPREEVTAAVTALQDAGIAAVAGWTYLAFSLAGEERARVLAARPHLADGVIVTDRAGWTRAREVLDAARLLPDSVVAVGGVDSLLDPDAPVIDGDRVLLVAPNPALYDPAAAAVERTAVRARQDARATLATELAARVTADRDLAATLAGWRRTYPPGRLAGLRAELAAAREAQGAAEADLAAATRAATAAQTTAQAALADVEPLRAAAQEAADRATELDQLARSVGDPRLAAREIERLAAVAGDAVSRAEAARERARSARRAAGEAIRRADEARRNAAAARTESATVIGAGELADPEPDQEPDPGGRGPAGDESAPTPPPVAVLRAAYEAASRTYAQVEVGADLRGEVERARRDEAAARAVTDALDPAVRSRARELLAGTSGGDAATRSAGEAQARRQVDAVGADLDEARERLGGLREELRQANAEVQRRGVLPLTGELVPADLDHAQNLLRAAAGAVERAETAYAQTRADRERLVDLSARHTDELDAFQAVAETLLDLPAETAGGSDGAAAIRAGTPVDAGTNEGPEDGTGEGPGVEPSGWAPAVVAFVGDAEQAREATRRLRAGWREAAARYAEAAAGVRAAADAVAGWAAQDRFEAVRTPARRQMIKAGREAVSEGAATWATALAPRLRSLDDDLAHIGRNRTAIVARLEGMVRAALGTLRAAGRLSRLPDRLGDWSGQDFLRISFAEPEDLALTEALGAVVDETAAMAVGATAVAGDPARARPGERRPGRTATVVRRDGMGLLLRGVRAAMPRGVRVEILKPDAVLRTERVRVSELGDVFSGGQQLTAAIILYCTMAALRANDRGHLRASHAGVLFLDNPIGRASASYLLDLQLAVADRLGVQLVYTTGLFDTSALSAFPLVVRLRNDADLRAGLKYLRVEEHLRPGLTPIEQSSAGAPVTGVVTATRLYSRPGPRGDEQPGAGGGERPGTGDGLTPGRHVPAGSS